MTVFSINKQSTCFIVCLHCSVQISHIPPFVFLQDSIFKIAQLLAMLRVANVIFLLHHFPIGIIVSAFAIGEIMFNICYFENISIVKIFNVLPLQQAFVVAARKRWFSAIVICGKTI